jgi:hypothetical protein
VIEAVDDPGQVADAVSGRVGKAAWIDLIHDPLPPPLRAVRLRRRVGGGAIAGGSGHGGSDSFDAGRTDAWRTGRSAYPIDGGPGWGLLRKG